MFANTNPELLAESAADSDIPTERCRAARRKEADGGADGE